MDILAWITFISVALFLLFGSLAISRNKYERGKGHPNSYVEKWGKSNDKYLSGRFQFSDDGVFKITKSSDPLLINQQWKVIGTEDNPAGRKFEHVRTL